MKGDLNMESKLFFMYLQDMLDWNRQNGITDFYNNGSSDLHEGFNEFNCCKNGHYTTVYVNSISAMVELNFPITLQF